MLRANNVSLLVYTNTMFNNIAALSGNDIQVRWLESVPYGVIGDRMYHCDHGPDLNKSIKEKYARCRQAKVSVVLL